MIAASATASASSFVLSLVAVRRLTLEDFGTTSLILTSGFLVAAMLRAGLGEVNFENAKADGGLGRSRIRLAIAAAVPIAILVLAPQFLLLTIPARLLMPATAFAVGLAASEVSRVRLVSLEDFSHAAAAEFARLFLLSATLTQVGESPTQILLAGTFATVPVVVAGYRSPHGTNSRLRKRSGATAAVDVLVQRGSGQLVSSIVFAYSAATVGAIAAARLGFAPLTTLYTAASGLALTGERITRRGVQRLLAVFVVAGAAYVVVAVTLTAIDDFVLQALSPEHGQSLRPLVLPIGIFALAGAVAPVVSTSLRRVGMPGSSLRARGVASVVLVAAVGGMSWLRMGDAAPVAWAYAGAGAIGALAWISVLRALDSGAEQGDAG